MYGEIMQAVKEMALSYTALYTSIENGAMPGDNSMAIYLSPTHPATLAQPENQHLDRGGISTLNLALNAKHADMGIAVSALSNVHTGLIRAKKYPKGNGWQIMNIRSAPSPHLIEREDNTMQWLYGSVLAVEFYMKGEH